MKSRLWEILNIVSVSTNELYTFNFIFIDFISPIHLLPLWLFQIMEVKHCLVAATGHCEGGSGHYGKEESEELDLLPARY